MFKRFPAVILSATLVLGAFGCSEDEKSNPAAPDPNPTVAITSPESNSRVADLLVIEAEATDDKGVALVEFYADFRLIGTDPVAPYQVQWNVANQIHASEHSIYAVAWDTDDHKTGSVPVVVAIDTALALPIPVVLGTPTIVNDSEITVFWSKSPDIDFANYRLLCDSNTQGPFVGTEKTLTHLADTTWTVSGLLDSIRYRFVVLVRDLAGHSATSNIVAGTTLNAPPASISLISVIRKSDRISFRWAPSSEHDFGSYRLIRSTDSTYDAGDTEITTINSRPTLLYDYMTTDTTHYVYFVEVADKYGLKSVGAPAIESEITNRFALHFNGTEYCTVPWFLGLDLGHNYTLEAWVNQEQTADFMRVIDKSPEGDPYLQYSLISDSRLGADYCGGGVPVRVHGDVGVSLNAWHHIALTYDHGYIVYYIDGLPVDNSPGNVNISCEFQTTLNIGRRKIFDEFYFRGAIDEVRVWNVTRTAQDVLASFDHHLSGVETGLVCYYDFDEGEGNVIGTPVGSNGYLGSSSYEDAADPNWINSTAPIQY